jgi:hypothetical protein
LQGEIKGFSGSSSSVRQILQTFCSDAYFSYFSLSFFFDFCLILLGLYSSAGALAKVILVC